LLSSASLAAVDYSIGVSPSFINLGELERGSTKIVKFFLVTPSTEPFLVYLESDRGSLDFFSSDKYKNLTSNYSEQDTISWVEFLKNPFELTPSNESLKTKGGEIRGWREVSFLLNVPKNAEPGYHLINVRPNPSLPAETLGQAGARVIAIVPITILFKVQGDAKREGVILDVTSGNYAGNRFVINTYFQNIGTATISAIASQSVYSNDKSIANISSSKELIKPGELKILKAYLPADVISFGDYNVFTTVSYTTGYASKNSTITISQLPAAITKPVEFPWWVMILILILLITIFIYKWYK
jgi:hypothetical protein